MLTKASRTVKFHDVEPEYILACLLLEKGGEVDFTTLWELSTELRALKVSKKDETHIYFSDISRDSMTSAVLAYRDYFEFVFDGIRLKENGHFFLKLLKNNTASDVATSISKFCKKNAVRQSKSCKALE
jgi:hypothetical protein